MMDRRAFIAGSAILILAPGAVAAQPERIWRIGYLSEGSVEKSRMAAFRQGLRELGYVERQNLIIEERYARQQVEKAAGAGG
jgi:putative ABC transport system substrate-binding protein